SDAKFPTATGFSDFGDEVLDHGVAGEPESHLAAIEKDRRRPNFERRPREALSRQHRLVVLLPVRLPLLRNRLSELDLPPLSCGVGVEVPDIKEKMHPAIGNGGSRSRVAVESKLRGKQLVLLENDPG